MQGDTGGTDLRTKVGVVGSQECMSLACGCTAAGCVCSACVHIQHTSNTADVSCCVCAETATKISVCRCVAQRWWPCFCGTQAVLTNMLALSVRTHPDASLPSCVPTHLSFSMAIFTTTHSWECTRLSSGVEVTRPVVRLDIDGRPVIFTRIHPESRSTSLLIRWGREGYWWQVDLSGPSGCAVCVGLTFSRRLNPLQCLLGHLP